MVVGFIYCINSACLIAQKMCIHLAVTAMFCSTNGGSRNTWSLATGMLMTAGRGNCSPKHTPIKEREITDRHGKRGTQMNGRTGTCWTTHARNGQVCPWKGVCIGLPHLHTTKWTYLSMRHCSLFSQLILRMSHQFCSPTTWPWERVLTPLQLMLSCSWANSKGHYCLSRVQLWQLFKCRGSR